MTKKKGFQKFDRGKPAMGLVSPIVERAVAEIMTHGRDKYGEWNFLQPAKWSRFLHATKRHINDWECGIDIDAVDEGGSGKSVIDHAIAELMILSTQIKLGIGTDDRPKQFKAWARQQQLAKKKRRRK